MLGIAELLISMYVPLASIFIAMPCLLLISYYVGMYVWQKAADRMVEKREVPLDIWDTHEND
jgi:hypothetical protein